MESLLSLLQLKPWADGHTLHNMTINLLADKL